jgi:predicted dehydrogenase
MKPIQYGIVGCGGFTQGHLEQMQAARGWELVGVVDPDDGNRNQIVTRAGIDPAHAFADEAAFYDGLTADVVFVHTPVSAHAGNCRRALAAGCHVCCQKPFVHDLAAGLELVEIARASKRVISVGQTMRMEAVTKTIARTIADGMIGEPRFGHRMVYRNRMRWQRSYHYQEDWPSIHVMGSHWMDLYRFWFGGRVRRVSFRGIACDWDPYKDPGAITGWVEMESGAVITWQESFISAVPHDPSRAPFEDDVIQGSKGAIHWTGPWGLGPVELWEGSAEKAVQIDGGGGRPPAAMTAIMDALRATLQENAPVFCPAADNLWSMAALFAAQQSAQQGGAPVDVLELAREAGLEESESS